MSRPTGRRAAVLLREFFTLLLHDEVERRAQSKLRIPAARASMPPRPGELDSASPQAHKAKLFDLATCQFTNGMSRCDLRPNGVAEPRRPGLAHEACRLGYEVLCVFRQACVTDLTRLLPSVHPGLARPGRADRAGTGDASSIGLEHTRLGSRAAGNANASRGAAVPAARGRRDRGGRQNGRTDGRTLRVDMARSRSGGTRRTRREGHRWPLSNCPPDRPGSGRA